MPAQPIHPGRQARPLTRFRSWESSEEIEKSALSIDDLIFPLWYDILVRRRFLEFYEKNRALYWRDFPEFMRRARRTDYYYHTVHFRYGKKAWQRWLRPLRLRHLFACRVHLFVGIFEEIRKQGFDRRHPIGIRLPAGPIRTREGKTIYRPIHMGGGRHRISALMQLGYRELPADYWTPEPAEHQGLDDETVLYLRAGRLTPAGHFAFLRDFYGRPRHRDFEHLLAEEYGGELEGAIRPGPRARRLVELASALRVDWRAMGSDPPAWFAPYDEWAQRAETCFDAADG